MSFKKWASRNKSGILSAIACVGVAVTAALTYLGTIKAQETIKEWTEEKHDELTKFEKVQASVPAFVAPVVAGAATMGCIIGAHRIDKKQVATATAALAIGAKRYDEYRKANIEANGIEADERAQRQIMVQHADMDKQMYAPNLCGYYTLNANLDDEERLFYDTITQQYFTSTLAKVIDAEYHANRCMCNPENPGEFTVAQWCEFLGIPNAHDDQRGWCVNDEYVWLDFNNTKPIQIEEGGLEAIAIECMWEPTLDYWNY